MTHATEWRCDLAKDIAGEITAVLYECDNSGQWSLVTLERFGPFDTALEVATWLTRHWAPRARLSLR